MDIDYLKEAKNLLGQASAVQERENYGQDCAARALACAVVALVERLDRMTYNVPHYLVDRHDYPAAALATKETVRE